MGCCLPVRAGIFTPRWALAMALWSREVSNMGVAAEEVGYRRSALAWDLMSLGFARRIASLAVFGLVYSIFVILGLVLRESSQRITILWPAAGFLFMALWLAPRRNW